MQHGLPRWLLFSTTLVSVIACHTSPSTQPADKSPLTPPQGAPISGQQVVQEYLDARLSGNWVRSYELVITDKPKESYVKDAEAEAPLARILGPASTSDVLEANVDGNTLKATASIQMPDLTPFIQKLIMNGVKAEMLGRRATYAPVMEELLKALESGQYDMVEHTQHFTLTKLESEWRVDLRTNPTDRQ